MRDENDRRASLTKRISCLLVFPLLCCLTYQPTYAASFDCANAKSIIEKTICADPKLSEMDEEIDVAFKAAKTTANAADTISQQRSWIKKRNVCSNRDCVEQLYTQRLNELKRKQDISDVLRQITRPKDKSGLEKISLVEDILQTGSKNFPPYPEIWGVNLPVGANVLGVYPSADGDLIIAMYGNKKSAYTWLSNNKTYVMTGLFSGKQWRIAERDAGLEKNRKNNGTLGGRTVKEVLCPIPISPRDPDKRDTCYAEIDYKFKNGNRLLYIRTDYEFPYCYRERYFKYLALIAPDGRVLRQVTPIVLSKSNQKRDALGDEPPCYDLLGGKIFKNINNWTAAPEISKFIPLADGTFILGFNGFYESIDIKEFIIRFDQNMTSLHPAFNREVFMVDTNILEKMGNIHSNPHKTIHENALQADRKLFNYLTDKNK